MKINYIKKIKIFSSAIVFSCGTSASALENLVTIGGITEFQGIYYKSNGNAAQQKVSTYQKRYGFYSSGNFFANYAFITDNDIKYGTKIGFQQTSRNDRGTPFSIYLESNLGKIEAGSDKSAGDKMKITGYTASCGTGNGWDSVVIASPDKDLIAYVTNFCTFLDAKTRTSMKSDYSRKITYYTPKIQFNESNSFQIGFSYVPDTSNPGHGEINANEQHTPIGATKFKFALKDGITYGVVYDSKLSQDLRTQISFVGEKAKAIGFDKATGTKSDISFKGINSYVLGGELKFKSFSFAASYMDQGQSLVSKVDQFGLKTSLYSIGAKYEFGKYAASINYFASDHRKNMVKATSIGMDYHVAKGIKTYVHATYYQNKGRYLNNNILTNDSSKGTVVFLGGKISF